MVIHPIVDKGGSVLGFAKTTHDLTERNVVQVSLRQSESQFRLLVNSVTGYAIYLIDLNGRLSSWNSGAERIKGYSSAEVIGRPFPMFHTSADRERGEPAAALAMAARRGRLETQEWRVRKNGDVFWASVVIHAAFDDAGTVIGFAKVTRDVTEAKRAQMEMAKVHEELSYAQKTEALAQMTGGIAHDFNNILMAVLGGLEIISRRLPDDPKITPLLSNAIRAAERGKSLVQRMLKFARKQDLKPEPIELPALLADMIDPLQRPLGLSIRIESQCLDAVSAVLADRHQLELAIQNLTMNARDAMPDGGTIVIAHVRNLSNAADPARNGPSDLSACPSWTAARACRKALWHVRWNPSLRPRTSARARA